MMTEYGIIFDTETTGLPLHSSKPLNMQPQIIEFAAIKVDWETLEEVDRVEFLCKNEKPLEPIITTITELTDGDLANEKPFAAYYPELIDFHLGVKHWVAHNISFDRKMMVFDLKRISKATLFPYPPIHHCTVAKSYSIKNHRLKLENLHKHYFGEAFNAHRAMPDTEALLRCVRSMRVDGLI